MLTDETAGRDDSKLKSDQMKEKADQLINMMETAERPDDKLDNSMLPPTERGIDKPNISGEVSNRAN